MVVQLALQWADHWAASTAACLAGASVGKMGLLMVDQSEKQSVEWKGKSSADRRAGCWAAMWVLNLAVR